jgi:ribosomal protein S18 acetylase RimI-like enzyme
MLAREDLPFADSLRALAGWNQTLGDWERFIAIAPEGCFLAEWNGTPAGTATTIVYGPELAWIGMVLVHPEFRRRGIGQALLGKCIDSLRERGARCIKLDATPLGRTVYDGLGFQYEWTLRRWVRPPAPPQDAFHKPGRADLPVGLDARQRVPTGLMDPLRDLGIEEAARDASLRAWRVTDERLLGPLDAAAFGVSRQRLLAALVSQSRFAVVLEPEPGRPAGFGMLRPGSQALYLGPVVATSADAGIRVIEALVTASEGQMIFWDVPDENTAAIAWAEQHGFAVQRPLTRMFLGENLAPGDPRKQFALAGPEVG